MKQNQLRCHYQFKTLFVLFCFISLMAPLFFVSIISATVTIADTKDVGSNPIDGVGSEVIGYDVAIPRVDNSNVSIDGNIKTNEYNEPFNDPLTNIIAYWEHNSVNLTVCLVSRGTGWVAIGIGDKMAGSNIIIGGASDNSFYVFDNVGTAGWDHVNDTDNGGTYDILESAATENTTHTIFEFIIPLDSKDSLDSSMQENGTYNIFFGFHSSSDIITTIHTKVSLIYSIYLSHGSVITPNTTPSWTFLLFIAVFISITWIRRQK